MTRFARSALLLAIGCIALFSSGCVAAIVAVCCASSAVAAGAVVATSAESTDPTVTIAIPEVACAACSPEVRGAITGAGGVKRLAEGSPRSRLVVTYEPSPGRPEAYTRALRDAGFAGAHEVGRS
jgi:hypothetical protein